MLLSREGAWSNQIAEAAMIAEMDAAMIAADMGTGKSRAALMGLENQRIVLICCPLAVGQAWVKQLSMWDPGRRAVLLTRGSTARRAKALADENIVRGHRAAVIVNYESCWRGDLARELEGVPWDAVLLDESHRIKSHSGKASKWLSKLAKLHPQAKRVCMTGTPTPHSPLDWWAQFRFLDPEILGRSFTGYRDRIAVMHPHKKGWVIGYRAEALLSLARRIDPYVYRIQASDVISLPTAIHTEISATLPPKARRVYDSLEKDMIAILESGEEISAANKLTLVLRLQQATGGYLADTPLFNPGQSPKELALADLLKDIPPREPIVVFCKFRHDLDSVTHVLTESERTVSELSGRAKSLESWQNGETDALVVQQQSGGVGIDLTRSSLAVYYSLSHSLGDYEQSLARIRRPGQNRPCRFVHLVVSDSVDESIYSAISKKRDVVEEVLSRLKSRRESLA